MKKRNKIFIGLLGIFSAVMLVFLFGIKVTNAVNCATGVVKGKTLTATCQTSTWSSCPSGYTNENRASVTDLKYGTNCSGSETCCFKDSEIENQSGTCGEGKGTCKLSVAIGGTICGDDEKIGEDTCSWGYSCCVPKTNVGVGTTNPATANPTAGASPTVPGAAGTGAGGSPATVSGTRTGSTGGLVPCTDDCTLCHLVLGFKNIYDYLLVLLLSATTLVVVAAGVMYMVSSGDKGMIDKAKSALTYALTAMILALVAWLIINATLSALGYTKVGSWYNFTCDTTQTKGPTGGTGGGTLPGTPGQNTGTPNGNCGGISTSGNANGQCQYASTRLSSTLDCIKGRMAFEPSNKFNIFAFSLGIRSVLAASGVNISSLYRPQSGNSCHAGGRNCKGETNASDLTGDMDKAAQAAIACGAETVIYQAKAYAGGQVYTNASDHYDHVHISVNNAQCGCDYLK